MVRVRCGETGRLISKDKFEGHIFPDPSASWSPEVSAVHLESKPLPVSLPSFRTVMYPRSIHKGYETDSGLSQRKRNKINNLPGQPPGHIQQPIVLNCPDQFDLRIVPGMRSSNQQISHGTCLGDTLLGGLICHQ